MRYDERDARRESQAYKKLFFAIHDISNQHYSKRNMGKLIVCCPRFGNLFIARWYRSVFCNAS